MENTEYPVQVSSFSETAISGVDCSPQYWAGETAYKAAREAIGP